MPLFAIVLLAAIGQASDQELQCQHSLQDQEQLITRTVQDGYTVTVRRKADPALTKDACVVEVRGPSGQVVFTRDGYNTKVHADGGRDVDNDGTPDLIIGHDTRGGSRCCWEYTILSLRPAPHVAGTFSDPSFEADVNRQTVVWSLVPFEDHGPDMAAPPTIAVAQQYRDGRFVEITSEYCAVILAGTARGWANLSQDLWQLEGSHRAASRADTGRPPSFEVETTRLSATTVALQMMYCGLDGDARELIRQVWPDDQHEKIRASIEAAVASARRRQ
jgi:hypothetical protein